MAKESGLAWTELMVDDATGDPDDIREDITDFSFSTPRAEQISTGIDKSAMERILLLADFQITLNGIFDDAVDKAHEVFRTVPSTSVARSVTMEVSGQQLDNEVLFTDYQLTRAAGGELTFTAPGALSNGTVPTWA